MRYFDWLCVIAVPDDYKRNNYSKMLRTLMDTEFYWVVPRDENRAKDGLELRDIFENEIGESCGEDGPCTILEMLVALAVRCNDEIMYDPDDPKHADRWFWMMIENLGLDTFDDKRWTRVSILSILKGFMDKNERNCLFPIKNGYQKYPNGYFTYPQMELWYQLNHYIMWRFGRDFG